VIFHEAVISYITLFFYPLSLILISYHLSHIISLSYHLSLISSLSSLVRLNFPIYSLERHLNRKTAKKGSLRGSSNKYILFPPSNSLSRKADKKLEIRTEKSFLQKTPVNRFCLIVSSSTH
jgi:hypothetical protein